MGITQFEKSKKFSRLEKNTELGFHLVKNLGV
jgi:hypothetical protein